MFRGTDIIFKKGIKTHRQSDSQCNHSPNYTEWEKACRKTYEDEVKEFGKGFSVRTLQQMKKFYVMFPNMNALRSQLTWTHYRLLLSVENEQARQWYMDEAIASAWSSRQLERQMFPKE